MHQKKLADCCDTMFYSLLFSFIAKENNKKIYDDKFKFFKG